MIVASAIGIIIQRRVVIRVRKRSAFIVPDNDLRVLLIMIPDPFFVQAVFIGDASGSDAAMAGPLPQLRLPLGIALSAVSQQGIRHFVNHISAVKTNRPGADHAFAVKVPHPADHQVLTGSRFVVRLLRVGQAGGNGAAGKVFSIDEHIEPLRQLINDNAHFIAGSDRFQQTGFHVAANQTVIVVQPFDQRPSVFVLAKHMHGGRRAVDGAAQLVRVHFVAAGGLSGRNGLFFARVQHGNGLHQQLPAGFCIGNIIGKVIAEPDFACFIAFQPFPHRFRLGGTGKQTGEAKEHGKEKNDSLWGLGHQCVPPCVRYSPKSAQKLLPFCAGFSRYAVIMRCRRSLLLPAERRTRLPFLRQKELLLRFPLRFLP